MQALQGVDDQRTGYVKPDLLLNLMDCLDMPLHENIRMKIIDQYANAGVVKYGSIVQRLEHNDGLWSLKQKIDFDKISMKSNRSFMRSANKTGAAMRGGLGIR